MYKTGSKVVRKYLKGFQKLFHFADTAIKKNHQENHLNGEQLQDRLRSGCDKY